MLSGLEEIADRPDEDEPADDHERIRQRVAARDARKRATRGFARGGNLFGALLNGVRDGTGVEVVAVRVLWWRERCIAIAVGGLSGRGLAGRAMHVESVLDQRHAETGPRPVFGCVGGVKEVGEEEADEREGH